MERRELCPASFRLEKDLPSFDTEHSIDGTDKHAQIAALISGEVSINEIADDAIRSAYEEFLRIRSGYSESAKVYVEKRVSFSYCGIEQFFGTADVLIVDGDVAAVIDWKFGHREVDAACNNSQGASYALCAMQMFGVKSVDVYFVNPVIWQKTDAVFDAENDKENLARYFMGVIARCQENDAPICAGEKQCRYCKAAHFGTCPAVAKNTTDLVKTAEALPKLSELSDEKMLDLLAKVEGVEKFCERIKNERERRVEASGEWQGWRFKEMSGGREISDINAAFSALSESITRDEFLECCSVSVAKIEKKYAAKLKENGVFKTEKEGKERFAELTIGIVADKPRRRTLVHN